MEWLSQNWLWILFVVGALLMLRRHRHGFGGLSGRHGGHQDHGEPDDSRGEQPRSEAAVDPVSGNAVRTEGALTSVFRERIYYFQSPENRAQFEAAPERYARAAGGEAPGSEHAGGHKQRRRRGC